jgi:hypothetical protein
MKTEELVRPGARYELTGRPNGMGKKSGVWAQLLVWLLLPARNGWARWRQDGLVRRFSPTLLKF